MESLIPIVAVVVVVLVILAALTKKRPGRGLYQPAGELFSPAELQFLASLDSALTPGQRAFGKVRVADLVKIRSGLQPRVRQIALNQVAQKHFDFVVCEGPKLAPICVVELNDSSHSSSRAKKRDEFIASTCDQIGLPLVIVQASRSYSSDAIRQQIVSATQPMPAEGARNVA